MKISFIKITIPTIDKRSYETMQTENYRSVGGAQFCVVTITSLALELPRKSVNHSSWRKLSYCFKPKISNIVQKCSKLPWQTIYYGPHEKGSRPIVNLLSITTTICTFFSSSSSSFFSSSSSSETSLSRSFSTNNLIGYPINWLCFLTTSLILFSSMYSAWSSFIYNVIFVPLPMGSSPKIMYN